MSWDTYALHAYAVEVNDLPLRDEIEALLNDNDEDGDEYGSQYQDINDVLEDLDAGCLDGPVFDKLKDTSWEFLSGPGAIKYIGYSAVMPYEQLSMTKAEMNKEIYDTLVYLCGEKCAEENRPEEIYEVWVE